MTTPPKDIGLRDYFAACALQSMRYDPEGYSQYDINCGTDIKHAKTYAAAAYRIADAMLAERGEHEDKAKGETL